MRASWLATFLLASVALGIVDVAPAQAVDPAKNEYLRSCEPCHGATGKGDGPSGKHLSTRPADLTKLSESNTGRFPLVRVFEEIDGRLEIALHGPRDMPVWGDRYKRDLVSKLPTDSVSNDMANVLARRRILELIEYLLTLQVGPTSDGSK
jgi:hypothetical protein